MREWLEQLSDLIRIMTNGNTVHFLDGGEEQKPPIGCAFTTLSDKCKLFILLKGIIDIDKEEAKLNKKRDGLVKQLETLKKEMSTANYETRVPEAVRAKNQEKVCLTRF
jgi:valyl-tRNA synthetase